MKLTIDLSKFTTVPFKKVNHLTKYVILGVLMLSSLLILRFVLVPRPRFALVTLFSENHICEAIHSCLSYSKLPEVKNNTVKAYAYYSPDVTSESLKAYKKVCPLVETREMDFTGLPEFTRNLTNYRFKYLMVNKILPLYEAVLYIDASITLSKVKNDSLTQIFYSISHDYEPTGFRTFINTNHTNFPVTHPKMYDFFNVTPDVMKKTYQFASGMYLVANTPQGRNVFDSLTNCALEPDCMAPPDANQKCERAVLRQQNVTGCHRFDQSAMNMRLIEAYGLNWKSYHKPSNMYSIFRAETVKNKEVYQTMCDFFFFFLHKV